MNKKFLLLSLVSTLCMPMLICEATAQTGNEATVSAGQKATETARLQPGANVQPYEIRNATSGEEYCQMCAYGDRAGTVAAYGNLRDDKFWSDLEKLQSLQKNHKNFGFFGQILDSTDAAAIAAEAKKHGITFPVVYAVDSSWSDVYKVGGVSRTIYYSTRFKVLWINVGLDGDALAKLGEQIKANPQS